MNEEIQIELRNPTGAGRLYPRYDSQAKVLAVESRVREEWPLGLNIGGTLVFDMNEDRRLCCFDLHVRRSRWQFDGGIEWPEKAPPCDLYFAACSLSMPGEASSTLTAALRVTRDDSRGLVSIRIGDTPATAWIALSAACVAGVDGDRLCGFMVRL